MSLCPLNIIDKAFGLKPFNLSNDIAFVHKLINGELSCSEFLKTEQFKISAFNFRRNRPFLEPKCLTNIIKYIPK